MTSKEIGSKIRKIRTHRKFSQGKLGELIDITRSNISQIENGNRHISVKTLIRILDALDVELVFANRKVRNDKAHLDSSSHDSSCVSACIQVNTLGETMEAPQLGPGTYILRNKVSDELCTVEIKDIGNALPLIQYVGVHDALPLTIPELLDQFRVMQKIDLEDLLIGTKKE